ncbi:sulfurtransferase [Deinococcus apachensis]|uniref:sulfurtransferase n=1 Tax=Deinococcus apachensis TaxID=309886 RepID=UPI0012FBAD91|nr:sulfurtransferase [Deinococcus apachensis]
MTSNAAPPSFVRPEFLVDSSWVYSCLQDPGVRIVDCGDANDYDRAHIPNAVPLGLHPWLKDEGSPHVINPDAFAQRMSELGVSGNTTVVAYDGNTGWLSARLWWVLRHYGHDDVRVLNGGWRGWVRAGYPVSVDMPKGELATFEVRRNNDILIRADELMKKVGQGDVQVVNLLLPAVYQGESNPFGNARTGHIPGSVNVPNETFSGEAGRFESAEAIRRAFGEVGVSPERETIVHCQAGIRSAHACLALTLAGWEHVRVYDASLAEWANREDTPLVHSS